MVTLHKYILRKKRVEITEELDLSVLNHLMARGVLTPALNDDIRAERTRRDQAARLLDILETRGDRAYSVLVETLTEVQSHLATMIEHWEKIPSDLGESI